MEFKPLKSFYLDFQPFEIHKMVIEFIVDSHVDDIDKLGYYDQTIENIHQAILCPTDDHKFWVLHEQHKCLGFAATSITTDIDNSKCFYIYLAYVKPEVRGNKYIKHCLNILKEEAKKQGCKYMVFPTIHDPKVFKRFLGKNITNYCTLLKEKL